jgi:hypothetical protein
MNCGRISIIFLVILFLISSICLGIVSEGEPQPDKDNNTLYLHYDMTNRTYWMNADSEDSKTEYWSMFIGSNSSVKMTFPLEPIDKSKFFIMDTSQDWIIRIHMTIIGVRTDFDEVRGIIHVGDHSATSNMPTVDGEYYIFELAGGKEVIDPTWNIDFEFYFETSGLTLADITVYFDGTSTITLPIKFLDEDTDMDGIVNSKDPDDDNDGYFDLDDEYPQDPNRWSDDTNNGTKKSEEKGEGFLPSFEITVLFICILILLVISRKYRYIS